MINFEHYRIFCTVCEAGGISKAAEQMFVSQPAVTSAIKHLENQLSVKLFYRTQRGVVLTNEGELLYSYVKDSCKKLSEGEEKLVAVANLHGGLLHAGASDMTLKFFLMDYLSKLRANYPEVSLRVTNAPTPQTIRSLKEGRIDIGFVSGPLEQDKDIKYVPVRPVRDIVICGEKYFDLADKARSFDELRQYPFIMLTKDTSTRSFTDSYMSKCGANICPEIELATSDLIVEFAAQCMGLAFVAEDFALPAINNGRLREIKLTAPFPERAFYMVTMENHPLPPSVKLLISYIRSDIEKSNKNMP